MEVATNNPFLLCLNPSGPSQATPASGDRSPVDFLALLTGMIEGKGTTEIQTGPTDEHQIDQQEIDLLAGLLFLSPHLLDLTCNDKSPSQTVDQEDGAKGDQNGTLQSQTLNLLFSLLATAVLPQEKDGKLLEGTKGKLHEETKGEKGAAVLDNAVPSSPSDPGKELWALLAKITGALEVASQGAGVTGNQNTNEQAAGEGKEADGDGPKMVLPVLDGAAKSGKNGETTERQQAGSMSSDPQPTGDGIADRLSSKADHPYWFYSKIAASGGTSKEMLLQERSSAPESGSSGLQNEKAITVVGVKETKVPEAAVRPGEGKIMSETDREVDLLLRRDMAGTTGHEDFAKMNAYQTKENPQTVEGGQFAAVLTERIEKIVEQYTRKDMSTDIMLRVRIDDKGLLLVGLRDEGQRIAVELRSPNQGLMSLLQTNKETIVRNLEGKNINTTIWVDPINREDLSGRERREERRDAQQQRQKEN